VNTGDVVGISAGVQAVDAAGSGLEARLEASDKRAILAALKELDLPDLAESNRGLNISYDRETRQSIVQIVDRDSGEVVKQIPGKDVVERARYYRELSGL
jgi:uncharacterized FlaG/YvyC family protein